MASSVVSINIPGPSPASAPLRFQHRCRPQIPLVGRRKYFTHKPKKIENRRQGYPRYAAFINSDRDFAVFRGFGELQARILLHRQDEIVDLEQKLDRLDNEECASYRLRSRRADDSLERKDLLMETETKLKEYHELLHCYFRQLERPNTRKENVRNVSHWLEGNKPLAESDSTFLDDWDDLISPKGPADKGGLDRFLERCIFELSKRGFKNRSVEKSTDQHVHLFSHSDIAIGSKALSTFLAVLTMVGPIFLLYNVQSTALRMWIITLFTSIFSSVLCTLTQSRNYEIFSATAAFCAVMVVFVGSLPGDP